MRFPTLLILLGLSGCAGSPAPVSSPTPAPSTPPPAVVSEPTPEPTPAPPPWKPTGDGWRSQNDQDGRPVWFRKVTADCGIYDYCLNYEVITEQGCDSLYLQASLRNEAGQNIDWTNDTVQGLRPKEVGLISLGANEPGNFTLDEINCR